MRSSGRNNPFELQRANAPPNPFMSGSCDKHLTYSESLSLPFVKGMRSIHRLGRHVRRRRIESEEEEKMQRGSELPVIHSNTSSAPFSRLSLAKRASSGRFQQQQKKRFAISFHTCRQLAVPTGNQLGWKGARKEWRVK